MSAPPVVDQHGMYDPKVLWGLLSQHQQKRLGTLAIWALLAEGYPDPAPAIIRQGAIEAERQALGTLAGAFGAGLFTDPRIPNPAILGMRCCATCGCTEQEACPENTPAGIVGCGWAGPALCTACAARHPEAATSQDNTP